MKKNINKIIFFIGIVLIIVGIILVIVRNKKGYYPKIEILEEITEEIIETDQKESILQSLNEMKNKNSDTYAYLNIPGTDISYPVMYTKGKDYYIKKDFNKEYSAAGSLYVDKHNNLEDDNIIIYGHTLKEGIMFSDLKKYLDEKYLDEHKKIIFVTEEYNEYEIISIFQSKVYRTNSDEFKIYKQYSFSKEKDFNYFYSNIKELSIYKDLGDAKYGDKFITLITCSDHNVAGRLVIVAKRI